MMKVLPTVTQLEPEAPSAETIALAKAIVQMIAADVSEAKRLATIEQTFVEKGDEPQQIEAALRYCLHQKWIVEATPSSFTITEARRSCLTYLMSPARSHSFDSP
jgi:hypothetical protein